MSMSSTVKRPVWSPLELRRAWLNIDDNRSALDFVQTQAGGLLLHFAFFAVLAASGQFSKAGLALSAVTLLGMWAVPAYRLTILVASSAFFVFMRPFRLSEWSDLLSLSAGSLGVSAMALQLAAVSVVVVYSFAFLAAMRRWPGAAWAKRPVVSLVVSFFLILSIAMGGFVDEEVSAVAWVIAGVFISCMWMLAYAALDMRTKDQTPWGFRALFLRPFWGGGGTPMGKSFGYLNKFKAKDEEDLAKTRLKGLKLAVWGLVLVGIWWAYEQVVVQYLGIPRLHDALLADAAGVSVPVATKWAVVLSNYLIDLLTLSVWGHLIVAVIRMCGYRIPRNTVNPLAARSIADFWNRYFYYYKELLVDIFFYPAFVRYFKGNVKLRIAFATFCAAGLGNGLYHFMRETHVFASGAFWDNMAIFQSGAVYSMLLATGLIVSQLRNKKPKPQDGFLRYEVLPRIWVIGFFCFLKIFDDLTGEGTLVERAGFAASLFGV